MPQGHGTKVSELIMQEIFEALVNMDEVRGLMFLGREGRVRFYKFTQPSKTNPERIDWLPQLLDQLQNIKEAEFIYERARLYIRPSDTGILFVWAGVTANMSMIRLNCDVSLDNWEKSGAGESGRSKRGRFRRR